MSGLASKADAGSSLMFIGLALWVAALLVVFLLPAAIRVGRPSAFVVILSVLALAGIGFMVRGLSLRRRNE